MKILFRIFVLSIILTPVVRADTFTYSFLSDSISVGGFEYTTAQAITGNLDVPGSQLQPNPAAYETLLGPLPQPDIAEVLFWPDIASSYDQYGNPKMADVIMVLFGDYGWGFDFPVGSFGTPGNYYTMGQYALDGTLTVVDPPTPVPEPGTWLLMGTGLLAIMGMFRYKILNLEVKHGE